MTLWIVKDESRIHDKNTSLILGVYDAYDEATRTIFWDPYAGLILGDGVSVMSASLCLAHEMGHAAQHLDGVIVNGAKYTKKQILEIEESNLRMYEIPIAKELGEFARRNYGDASGWYKMANPIQWGVLHTVRPAWHYLNPFNWGKPSKYFENLNPNNGVKIRPNPSF